VRLGLACALLLVPLRAAAQPVLDVSTYLGGSGDDFGCGVAVGRDGAIYVAGWTSSTDLPTTAGAAQPENAGDRDAFVAKLDPTGTQLVYLTYLGGTGTEFEVVAVAVDEAGNAFVSGSTKSSDFPATEGAFQTELHGEVDAFVAKLSPDGGDVLYATYLGGAGIDGSQTVVLDGTGFVYTSGYTGSPDFPTTPGSAQPDWGGNTDAFVTKLAPELDALAWSTYVGGSADEPPAPPGLAVDAAGRATVVGSTLSTDFPATPDAAQPEHADAGANWDAFVAEIAADGASFAYATYFGGTGYDEGRSVRADLDGRLVFAGLTESDDLPVTPNAYQSERAGLSDAFAGRVTPGADAFDWVTYLGGGGVELTRSMDLDPLGNVYVAGAAVSPNYPTTSGAIQSEWAGGEDAFVGMLSAQGDALLYSTFLGGTGHDRARGIAWAGAPGSVALAGFTGSSDFPTIDAATQPGYAGGGLENCFFPGGCDGFVARIDAPEPGGAAAWIALAALMRIARARSGRSRRPPRGSSRT
jgi:hypothetical protein